MQHASYFLFLPEEEALCLAWKFKKKPGPISINCVRFWDFLTFRLFVWWRITSGSGFYYWTDWWLTAGTKTMLTLYISHYLQLIMGTFYVRLWLSVVVMGRGRLETGDCHHITAILIHTEISQRAPSGHFHQSWGAIVYRYFHFFKTYSTPSNIPRISGFTKTYNRQCNVNLDCVCFVLLLVFAKCPHCSMQGKWE